MKIGQLIEYLKKFNPKDIIIIDVEGNTYEIDIENLKIWDEQDIDSPIAYFI